MSAFKNIFGIEPVEVRNKCVIVPFLTQGLLKKLGINALKRGKLYAVANVDTFTFIKAGVGATLVGDAVLYLEETGCQEIIYLGSCGLLQESSQLTIGSLVCPEKYFAFEGFTDVILKHTDKITTQYPDRGLFQSFLQVNQDSNITKVTGISLGSIRCEESYKGFLVEKGIEVVDMDCSAFFSAARHIKRKAVVLLYISDIVGKKSIFESLEPEERFKIDNAIQAACSAIKLFCKR